MKTTTIKQEITEMVLIKIKRLLPKHLKVPYEMWREDLLKEIDRLNYKK